MKYVTASWTEWLQVMSYSLQTYTSSGQLRQEKTNEETEIST